MNKIESAHRLIAKTHYGEDGEWLCRAFDVINRQWFDGELPFPLIVVQITPHGGCLGWTRSSSDAPPMIAIHPTMFGQREKNNPWRIPTAWLGRRFAFDVLVHEMIHVSVHYLYGGYKGPTSHNNPQWIGEVNRIAPLMGFEGIEAGRQISKRHPIPGTKGKRGKPLTKNKKTDTGNIPFKVTAGFPDSLRMHLGTAAEYYTNGNLPLDV